MHNTDPTQTHDCLHCGFPNVFYLHCKIRCTNCGFMLDCSDLDVGGEVQRASKDNDTPPPNPRHT